MLLAVCGTLVSLRAQRKYNDVGKGASHAEDTDGSSSSGEDGSVASYEDASAMAARTIQASARHLLARKLANSQNGKKRRRRAKKTIARVLLAWVWRRRALRATAAMRARLEAQQAATHAAALEGVARTIQACARRLLARHLLAHMKLPQVLT